MGLVRTSYNINWAGYVIESADNNNVTYDKAWAKWEHPTYTGTSAAPSFWTGLGGTGDPGFIIQAGTTAGATNIDFPVASSNNMFWTENFPLSLIWQAEPELSSGDTAYIYISYGGLTSPVVLQNYTTEEYTIVNIYTPYYDGTNVDYIHEAYDCKYDSWGYSTFFQCGYHDNTGNGYLSDGCAYQEDIMRFLGVWKAWPSSVNNSEFTVYSY
jgi:hypothetical protein